MRFVIGAALVSLVLCNGSLRAQSQQDDAIVTRGAAVYQYWCSACHSAGRGMPGTTALAAKYKGRQPDVPAVLDQRVDLTPQSIRLFVRKGVSVMAPFRKTEIPETDLNALIAYLTRPRS